VVQFLTDNFVRAANAFSPVNQCMGKGQAHALSSVQSPRSPTKASNSETLTCSAHHQPFGPFFGPLVSPLGLALLVAAAYLPAQRGAPLQGYNGIIIAATKQRGTCIAVCHAMRGFPPAEVWGRGPANGPRAPNGVGRGGYCAHPNGLL